MKPLLLSTVVLLLVLTAACKKEKADQVGFVPTEPIPGNVEVTMQPAGTRYGETVPFSLYCETVYNYPSSFHRISYSVTKKSSGYEIALNNVEKVGLLTAFGPAICYVPMDGLYNGTYDLSFILNGATSRYTLIVSSQSYKIVPADQNGGVLFTSDELIR